MLAHQVFLISYRLFIYRLRIGLRKDLSLVLKRSPCKVKARHTALPQITVGGPTLTEYT